MKKRNLLKSLILVMAVLISTVEAYATATAVSTLSVSSLPSVAIEKNASSKEEQTLDPQTGIHPGLQASFNLQVNGTDSDYIFVLGSKLTAYGGEEVSAYSNDGDYLLFGWYGEEDYMPTLEAIEDARVGGSNNPNVIAYPISDVTISSPMSVSYDSNQDTGEGTVGCYVIKVNDATEGTLEQIISGTPQSSTYSSSQDMAGSYRAVVYFTAISK